MTSHNSLTEIDKNDQGASRQCKMKQDNRRPAMRKILRLALLASTASILSFALESPSFAQSSYIEPVFDQNPRGDTNTRNGYYSAIAPRAFGTGYQGAVPTRTPKLNFRPLKPLSTRVAPKMATTVIDGQTHRGPTYRQPLFQPLPSAKRAPGQAVPDRGMANSKPQFQAPLIRPRSYFPADFKEPLVPTGQGSPHYAHSGGGSRHLAPNRKPKSHLDQPTDVSLLQPPSGAAIAAQRPAVRILQQQENNDLIITQPKPAPNGKLRSHALGDVAQSGGTMVISAASLKAAAERQTPALTAQSRPKPLTKTAAASPAQKAQKPTRKVQKQKPKPRPRTQPKPVIAEAPKPKIVEERVVTPEEPAVEIQEAVVQPDPTPAKPQNETTVATAPQTSVAETVSENLQEQQDTMADTVLAITPPAPSPSEALETAQAETLSEEGITDRLDEASETVKEAVSTAETKLTLPTALPPQDPEPPVETAPPAMEQTASLTPADNIPPAAVPTGGRVLFAAQEAELSENGKVILEKVAASVAQADDLRLQLQAYAAGTEDQAASARRLSLSRALAVRAFLIEKGIRATRIDVRAYGVKSDDPQADRVDIVVLQ